MFKINIAFILLLIQASVFSQIKFDSCIVYHYNANHGIKEGKLLMAFDKIKNDSIKHHLVEQELCDKLSRALHRAKPSQFLIGTYPENLVYLTLYSFGKGHDFVLGCYQDMIINAKTNVKYIIHDKKDKIFIEELFQRFKHK